MLLLLFASGDIEGVQAQVDVTLEDATAGAAVTLIDQVHRRGPVRSYLWLYDVEGVQAGVIA